MLFEKVYLNKDINNLSSIAAEKDNYKYFDTIIHKNFENRTKNTKDMSKLINWYKLLKGCSKAVDTAYIVYLNILIKSVDYVALIPAK